MTPVLPYRVYLAVYASLLVLTAVTTGVAYLDLGPFNSPVAIGIAVVKAVAVAWFFMHLAYTHRRTQLAAAAGILWLAIMITFSLSDVLTRGLLGSPVRW